MKPKVEPEIVKRPKAPAGQKLAALLLGIYVIKRLQKKAEAYLDNIKVYLASTRENPEEAFSLTQENLMITVNYSAGRKTFDPKKAESFLREKMTDAEFDENFTDLIISTKKGKKPPKDLLKKMEDYFVLESRTAVTQERFDAADHGLSDKEVKEKCYSAGRPFHTLLTPTIISDKELLEKINAGSGNEKLLEQLILSKIDGDDSAKEVF